MNLLVIKECLACQQHTNSLLVISDSGPEDEWSKVISALLLMSTAPLTHSTTLTDTGGIAPAEWHSIPWWMSWNLSLFRVQFSALNISYKRVHANGALALPAADADGKVQSQLSSETEEWAVQLDGQMQKLHSHFQNKLNSL